MAAHKYVPSYMYSAKYVMDVGRCTIKIKYTVRRTPEYMCMKLTAEILNISA
jgi:hypothetical protein